MHVTCVTFRIEENCWLWSPYLMGRKFRLRTDHGSLHWLKNFKDPVGQFVRWLEKNCMNLILKSYTDKANNMLTLMLCQEYLAHSVEGIPMMTQYQSKHSQQVQLQL